MRNLGLGLMMLAGLGGGGAAIAAAPPPIIGHMGPSDVPDMPKSDVVRDYDDWVIEKSSTLVAAMTYSIGGDSMFGLFCGKTCSYYTNPGIDCHMGQVGAGLITSSAGTMAVTLRCFHVREEGEEEVCMLIDEDLTNLLAGVERFSLTITLANGKQHVDLYSMKGAEAAERDMLNLAVGMTRGASPVI